MDTNTFRNVDDEILVAVGHATLGYRPVTDVTVSSPPQQFSVATPGACPRPVQIQYSTRSSPDFLPDIN